MADLDTPRSLIGRDAKVTITDGVRTLELAPTSLTGFALDNRPGGLILDSLFQRERERLAKMTAPIGLPAKAFVEVSPNVVNARALEAAYRWNTVGDDRVRPSHAALTGTITFEPVTYKVRNFRCSVLFWPPRDAAKIRAWARKNIPGRAWRRWSTARLRRIWFKAEAARTAREMRTFPDALGATLADAAAELGQALIDGLTGASEVRGG